MSEAGVGGDVELRVRVLGPLEVYAGEAVVGPAGGKRRGLFALLALEANRVVPTSRLIDQLWAEAPPESAPNLVQTYVSDWRAALHPGRRRGADSRIETVSGGYRLRLLPGESDLEQFKELVASARSELAAGDQSKAAEVLGQAMGLWRGPALADLVSEPWHAGVADGLEGDRLAAMEEWANAALSSGAVDPQRVGAILAEAAARYPLRERLAELVLWALFAQGRQADALAAFDQARRHLADELGIDPGPGLAAMHQRVLQQDLTLRPTPAPTSVAATVLPVMFDSFIGRDQELAEVTKLLGDYRLVTLTGPGGSGKTRLAVEVAAAAAARSDAGRVEFVDLSPLTDGTRLLERVAGALNLPPAESGQTVTRVLAGALATGPFLLVLDNLEQLSTTAPVLELLRAGPAVRVLATSRQPLGIQGERAYPVLPLPVSAETGEVRTAADELFLDRATAAHPQFHVDDEETSAAVAGICRRLDGLPLAIELAAPWVRLLPASELLARLAAPLTLLADPSGDRPDRQQTLRATLDWSYSLLRPSERALLARLAVFSSGADLTAIEAVCVPDLPTPILEPLRGLVEKSLVRRVPESTPPRYRLLETVRAYAAERLDEIEAAAAVRDRHAAYYTELAEQIGIHNEGPDGEEWIARARVDADNLRAAADRHTQAGRHDQALQVVTDLSVLWWDSGLVAEGRERLEALLAEAPADAAARPMAHALLGWLGLSGPTAEAHARRAVDLARKHDDPHTEAFALQTLGTLIRTSGCHGATHQAIPVLEAAIAVAHRGEGRPVRNAEAAPAAVIGSVAHELCIMMQWRDLRVAQGWAEEALSWAEREGFPPLIALDRATLGYVALLRGDEPTAKRFLTEADIAFRSADLPVYHVWCVYDLACLAHAQGHLVDAERGYREVLQLAPVGRRLPRDRATIWAYQGLVDVFTDRGDVNQAQQALQEARRLFETRPELAYAITVRAARIARITGNEGRIPELLAEAEGALDPDELHLERMIWYVESAYTALRAGDRAGTKAILDHAEEHARRVGLAIWPREEWHVRTLRADLVAFDLSEQRSPGQKHR